MAAKGYLLSERTLSQVKQAARVVENTPVGRSPAIMGREAGSRFFVEITGRYRGSNWDVDKDITYTGKLVIWDSGLSTVQDVAGGLVFGVDADSNSMPPIVDLTMANYSQVDSRDAAQVHMVFGTVVEVFATMRANREIVYATYGAKAHEYVNDSAYPDTGEEWEFDSEGTESVFAEDSGWPTVKHNSGFTITTQTRTFYSPDSNRDRVLYGYYRDFQYNAMGVLLSMSAERRQAIAELSPPTRFALITSDGSTAGYYEADEQVWDDSADTWINKPGGFGFDSAGAGEVIEFNLNAHVPVGIVVPVYQIHGDDDEMHWFFSWDEHNVWGKPTAALGGGSYTVAELNGDASTVTGRTFSAQEVSGRVGIPLASDSVFRIFVDPLDNTKRKFEYHGAPSGTEYTMLSGTSTTANTDTWLRSSQGSYRGVIYNGPRIAVDTSSGAVYMFTRKITHDANGHIVAIDAEVRKQVFTLDPTAIDCGTHLAPDDASIVSSLYVWLDASQLTGLSDTDPVATYTDQSGSGNSPTQSTSSLKPTYLTNVYKGGTMPTVRFDGTDDYMDKIANLLPVGSDFTVVAVAAATCISNNDGSTETNPGGGLGTALRLAEEGGSLKQTVGWLGNGVVGATGGPAVNVLRHTASGDTECWQDAVAGTTISHQWQSQYQDLVLGRYSDGATFVYDPMDLCELLIYSSKLTDEEIEQVTCYLLDKWV